MSGGFFRGTSSEQDTRFSNKMAKLLKTQKFAPELDQLVDMAKVKMDVIRPWIAKKVTELLGFEDEVLINFIFGLLEGKDVDGKQIQIQLTGFMEKNTGKFMKELWTLLTSAQNNISGIPQQFLDAKAEETRKKKAEDQRIVSEVLRKKEEERELLLERERKHIFEAEATVAAAAANSTFKRSPRTHVEDQSLGEVDTQPTRSSGKNGTSRRSHSNDRSPLGHLHGRENQRINARLSQSRSRSKSSSSSRSLSRSPRARRGYHSRSRSRSPRRFFHSRSPVRRVRSPLITRSPPRSPARRGRSPLVPRSPPRRRRSPVYSRSPLRRRKSPTIWSPPRPRRRSPIFVRSPRRRRPVLSPSPRRRRSPSFSESPSPPRGLRSPSRSPFMTRRSLSRERAGRFNGLDSRKDKDHFTSQRTRTFTRMESPEARIPLKHQQFEKIIRDRRGLSTNEQNNRIAGGRLAVTSPSRQHRPLSVSLSPHHDTKRPPHEETMLGRSPSRNAYENRRSPTREQVPRHADAVTKRKHDLPVHDNEPLDHRVDSIQKRDMHGPYPSETHEQAPTKTFPVPVSVKESHAVSITASHLIVEKHQYELEKDVQLGNLKRRRSLSRESSLSEDKRQHLLKRHEVNASTSVIVDGVRKPGGQILEPVHATVKPDMDDEDYKAGKQIEVQRTRREDQDSSSPEEDDDRSDSPTRSDERRRAKKRRKEEKRMRKEVRRRKREERHRRKEEKRAVKSAFKAVASVTPPPDLDKDASILGRPDDYDSGREVHRSEEDEMETEQKRLENELRKKALDSLRAKKAIKP